MEFSFQPKTAAAVFFIFRPVKAIYFSGIIFSLEHVYIYTLNLHHEKSLPFCT